MRRPHAHEPEIGPVWSADGRCLICEGDEKRARFIQEMWADLRDMEGVAQEEAQG